MPPMRISQLESIAEAVLEEVYPEALQGPLALDMSRLFERELPRRGIHLSPASTQELGDREAATDPSGSGDIEILMAEPGYELLFEKGPRANRSRATAAHELGHAILHVPVIRQWRNHVQADVLLARHRRAELRAFEDPEWQAWTLGASILIPRKTLVDALDHCSVDELCGIYGVSRVLMTSHLRRLKLPIPKH